MNDYSTPDCSSAPNSLPFQSKCLVLSKPLVMTVIGSTNIRREGAASRSWSQHQKKENNLWRMWQLYKRPPRLLCLPHILILVSTPLTFLFLSFSFLKKEKSYAPSFKSLFGPSKISRERGVVWICRSRTSCAGHPINHIHPGNNQDFRFFSSPSLS
jgi:hypothetical protein